jgi:transcriptional regulator with XRE-family HTH domain
VNTWEVEHARRIGAEVQRLRKAAKLSAQSLSEKTDQLGFKITRQTIADLENGRRRFVTTAELVILAVALDTPPVCLVYPGPYDNTIEIIPGREGIEFDAAQWFSGIALGDVPIVPAQDRELDLGSADSDTAEKLEAWRELSAWEAMRGTSLILNEDDRERRLVYDQQIAAMRKRLGLKGDRA